MTRTRVGLAIAAAAFLFALAAGCEEEQAQGPDIVKKHRLIASENLRLKDETATLKKQIDEQKEQLAKCEHERQDWEFKAGKGMEEENEKMIMMARQSEAGLRAENARLSAEIAKLKGESVPEPNTAPEQPKEEEEKPKADEGQTANPATPQAGEEKPQGSEQSQPPALPQ